MSLKTITIVIVATVLILGIGFALFISATSPAATVPSTQTTQNNSYGGSNQTTVTNQSQTPAQLQKLPDINKEYDTLFQKILAQRISFTVVDSTAGDIGSVYALYTKDIDAEKKAYPNLTKFPISIVLVDLTDDNISEALVEEDLPGYCGSGGCPLDIYKKINSKWVLLFSTLASGDIGLSNTITNGYRDLFLSVPGDLGYQNKIIRYVWDGKQYNPGEVVATWDGTTFITP